MFSSEHMNTLILFSKRNSTHKRPIETHHTNTLKDTTYL